MAVWRLYLQARAGREPRRAQADPGPIARVVHCGACRPRGADPGGACTRPMRLHTILRSNAAVLCAVILAEFALFEAGLRLKGGSEAAPEFQRLFTPDPVLGYRLKPGSAARFTTAAQPAAWWASTQPCPLIAGHECPRRGRPEVPALVQS